MRKQGHDARGGTRRDMIISPSAQARLLMYSVPASQPNAILRSEACYQRFNASNAANQKHTLGFGYSGVLAPGCQRKVR